MREKYCQFIQEIQSLGLKANFAMPIEIIINILAFSTQTWLIKTNEPLSENAWNEFLEKNIMLSPIVYFITQNEIFCGDKNSKKIDKRPILKGTWEDFAMALCLDESRPASSQDLELINAFTSTSFKYNELNNFSFLSSGTQKLSEINLFVKLQKQLMSFDQKISIILFEEEKPSRNLIEKMAVDTQFSYIIFYQNNRPSKIYLWDKVNYSLLFEQKNQYDYASPLEHVLKAILYKTKLIERDDLKHKPIKIYHVEFNDLSGITRSINIKLHVDLMTFFIKFINNHHKFIKKESAFGAFLEAFLSFFPHYYFQLDPSLQSSLKPHDIFQSHYNELKKNLKYQMENLNSFGKKSNTEADENTEAEADFMRDIPNFFAVVNQLPKKEQEDLVNLLIKKLVQDNIPINKDMEIIYCLIFECRHLIEKEKKTIILKRLQQIMKKRENDSLSFFGVESSSLLLLNIFKGQIAFWENTPLQEGTVDNLITMMKKEKFNSSDIQSLIYHVHTIRYQQGELSQEKSSQFIDAWFVLFNNKDKSVLPQVALNILTMLSHWIHPTHHAKLGLDICNQYYQYYQYMSEEDVSSNIGSCFKAFLVLFCTIHLWLSDELKNELVSSLFLFNGDDIIFSEGEYEKLRYQLMDVFFDKLSYDQQSNHLNRLMVDKNVSFLSVYPKWQKQMVDLYPEFYLNDVEDNAQTEKLFI